MLWWKFAIFLMTFSKPQVIFSSNSASLFSVMKDTSRGAFRSNIIYLAQKEPIKVKILSISSAQGKIHLILVIFETTNQFFFEFCINLQGHETHSLYFFSWNYIFFQQKEPTKVHIWSKFMRAVESLKFCTLMGSFCQNHIKLQLKKYRRVIFYDNEEWCKV